MAKTIGQLVTTSPATALSVADYFEVEQGGNSAGATGQQLLTFIQNNFSIKTPAIKPITSRIATTTTYILYTSSYSNVTVPIAITKDLLIASSTTAQSLIISSEVASTYSAYISIAGSSSTILHNLCFDVYVASSGDIFTSIITKEESYTPTFTGFGATTSTVNFTWERRGNKLIVNGRFTAGTPTATEARISLPNGLISDTNLISTIQLCGIWTLNDNIAGSSFILIEPNVSYITFSLQTGSQFGSTKRNGNEVTITGKIIILQFEIPIQNWN
jgi:hypothetical protein